MDTRHVKNFLEREAGYSLTELLVVIVIIGVLALMAIPKYMDVVKRSKMTEAKTMLRQVRTLQEAYYYEHDRYGKSLPAIGFEQNRLVTEEGNARYAISIEEANLEGFTATATAVVDFDKDGTHNVWAIDQGGQLRERQAD